MAEKNQKPELKQPPSRRYWYVDAKWICGLLLLVALASTLLVFNAWRLTERERAIELATLTIASAFSPNGLDDPADIEKLKAQELADPDDVVTPIPNLPLSIPESDLVNASPREIRLTIFRRITEPFYDKGPEELAKEYVPNDPEAQQKFVNDSSLLRLFSAQSHAFLRNLLNYLVPISLLLLTGVIYFSYRFGKLVAPALILLVVCLPPFLVLSGIKMNTARQASQPLAASEDQGFQLGPILKEVSGTLFDPIISVYRSLLLVALLMLIAAMIGKIVNHFIRKPVT